MIDSSPEMGNFSNRLASTRKVLVKGSAAGAAQSLAARKHKQREKETKESRQFHRGGLLAFFASSAFFRGDSFLL
jgi:hypothetical protein